MLLLGVSASSACDAWAVGRTQVKKSSFEGLALHWNGTAWRVVASPSTGSTDGVGAVASNLGDAIVWAAGDSGPAGSFNPLVLRNG